MLMFIFTQDQFYFCKLLGSMDYFKIERVGIRVKKFSPKEKEKLLLSSVCFDIFKRLVTGLGFVIGI